MIQQLLALALVLLTFSVAAMAQSTGLFARVSSVTGTAVLTTAEGSPGTVLSRGYTLNPGDHVDTRQGGRVVIDLSDGSLVIVQPGSYLTIRDFRAATSVRELFDILLGAVRVRIHHLTGKPNPYRMNSPTASIAVRGTEFDVVVEDNGETSVSVFEGAVEVGRLDDPNDRALIEAGRSVLVRPGQLLQVRPQQIARAAPPQRAGPGVSRNQKQAQPTNAVRMVANKGGSQKQRTVAAALAPEARNEVSTPIPLAETPLLFRFNAYADLHLDTYENPAYAGFSDEGETRASVYGNAPQVSLVQPLPGGIVAGATAATGPLRYIENTAAYRAVSAFGARRFGRTSFGVSVAQTDSTARTTSVTAGMVRELSSNTNLSLFVRNGTMSLAGSTGRSAEAGVRLRGAITSRLSYGLTASLSTASAGDARLRSVAFGAGAGYALGRGTLLSADLTAGTLSTPARTTPFQSMHVAVQKDITRRLFGTASVVRTWRSDDITLPLWRTRYAEIGAGWRFTESLSAQYLLLHDNVTGGPQHTIGVRFTFRTHPR